ncbi:hypothetical protein HCH15_09785 [Corynebacterium testudinoris]|uniref:Putative DUF2567 family protein n=1 Tax=Corynebacterium testudinoris TaxID=136857 RepID=A0A0G3HDH9_9CORY|nr:hypothetical protein [Corynebacterium testudinoris]AKK09177.1 putative DUF2567 family protein [Corynebacterium testudinoris]MBX8996467.1 hypothetical protein [Corynebacterium testudinoris]
MTVPRAWGSGAGVLAASLLAFSLCGAVWGLLRPAYRGTLTADGNLQLDSAFNVEFSSFISFVVATGLVATVMSLSAFIVVPDSRGPGMLWWVVFVSFVSALAFIAVGEVTSSLRYPMPDVDALSEGDFVTIVPALAPGVGLLAAPFMAALAYWCSALVSPDEEPSELELVR